MTALGRFLSIKILPPQRQQSDADLSGVVYYETERIGNYLYRGKQ